MMANPFILLWLDPPGPILDYSIRVEHRQEWGKYSLRRGDRSQC